MATGASLYGAYDFSWEADLEGAVAFYQSYFNYMYPEWYSWREGKIQASNLDSRRRNSRRRAQCDVSITDELTGESYHVEMNNGMDVYAWDTINSCSPVVSGWQKLRMMRERARSMVATLQTVMSLQRFIPGMESAPVQVLPSIQNVTLGPFAPYTQFISDVTYRGDFVSAHTPKSSCSAQDSFGGPGHITEVDFRSGAEVDWFDIQYEEDQDCYAGNSKGGDPGEIQELGGNRHGVGVCFSLMEKKIIHES